MTNERIIGLIGGMTWQTTVDYYTILNERVNKMGGDRYTPRIVISSMNLQEYVDNLDHHRHEDNVKILIDHAKRLEAAGAECLGMCSNTSHVYADQVQAGISIPIIDIAEATALEVQAAGLKNVALLGTRYTMQAEFFTQRLSALGINRARVSSSDEEWVHTSIVDELTRGTFPETTKESYIRLIERLHNDGADGVILGCTEIPLLLRESNIKVPTFDTLMLHCKALISFAYAP